MYICCRMACVCSTTYTYRDCEEQRKRMKLDEQEQGNDLDEMQLTLPPSPQAESSHSSGISQVCVLIRKLCISRDKQPDDIIGYTERRNRKLQT